MFVKTGSGGRESEKKKMKKVAVIGAGASGLMASYAAAKKGNEVTVFEKNEKAGKKIYITGKGRCNVTNDTTPEGFLENVVRNRKFLTGCAYTFPPERMMRFLEDGGLPLKVERGNRVFPASDKASDVTKCLERCCRESGVRFCFQESVVRLDKLQDGRFEITTSKGKYIFDRVIVCSGGISYPATGSTGDGYKIAEAFGLKVVQPRSALCGIICDMTAISRLQGLTLKNVRVSAAIQGKEVGAFFGEMLFTHFGVSGPIVLSLSSLLNDVRDFTKVRLEIDLKPALDEETLDKRLLRDFDKFKNKQMQNALDELLPKSLVLPVLLQAKIREDLAVNSLTKESRRFLLHTLKAFELRPIGLRPVEEGIVTAGGIDVRQIDPKTMQSKTIEGLYFCGEVLDVDAFTGGFNLQIAFSTGFVAGNSIS